MILVVYTITIQIHLHRNRLPLGTTLTEEISSLCITEGTMTVEAVTMDRAVTSCSMDRGARREDDKGKTQGMPEESSRPEVLMRVEDVVARTTQ
jgi:hypothetical protein